MTVSDAQTADKKKVMRTIGRIAGITAVTLVSAVIAHMFTDSLVGLFASAVCGPQTYCVNDGMSNVMTLLGGVFGFWLVHTGRLARLFRKI